MTALLRWIRRVPWARRVFGLFLGIAFLLAFEGLCRLAGWGLPDPSVDPFASFQSTSPLFTVDPLTNTHVTAPERLKFFIKDRFPRRKAANTFRIFCLGGSTVQGRPYSIETAFSTWLRLSLEAAYPDRRFEVVNCGGVSYASYRLLPILKECLGYAPDLFIVGTGQNEFLEERTYGSVKRWQAFYHFAHHWRAYHLLRNLRSVTAATTMSGEDKTASRPILKQEVDALLDYRGGLESYQRNDALIEDIQNHFRNNIERLIATARQGGVPLLFLRPPVNLKDCPPFKSESTHPETEALLAKASQVLNRDADSALHVLERAVALDPRCADAHYQLGQAYMGRADYRSAERHFWRALEEDLCQLRLLPKMAEDLKAICRGREIDCLDLHVLLGIACPQGLVGDEILVDHVHPSIRGHQMIARSLQDALRARLGAPTEGWEARRDTAFKEHLEGIDALYYAHGQQRLLNLHLWTQGRADGPPIGSRQSPPSLP